MIVTRRAMVSTPLASEERAIDVRLGPFTLEGRLGRPPNAAGLVIWAQGGGPGLGPRQRIVTEVLHNSGLATITLNLLTPAETAVDQRVGELRYDVGLLADRLVAATDWAEQFPDTRRLPMGYLAGDTVAAAALAAAAARPNLVGAVVAGGGRPDLADEAWGQVQAPTLLLVGERDVPAIGLNEYALEMLPGKKRLDILPGAGSLLDEAGPLEAVARRARDWFVTHLPRPAPGND
jgi:pimeloyl-ACP methyl ester carboxylesterase